MLAGELLDTDPDAAYAHAEAARRRAARLPIVREGTAETAYAAGKYDTALGEYRALRRMTGLSDYLPVMADCERALGRPQQALKLIKEAEQQSLHPASRVELRIVEAGARRDLGQTAEAVRLLRATVAGQPKPDPRRPDADPAPLVRLHYALADALLEQQDRAASRAALVRAAELDVDNATDAQERLDAMDGLTIDYDDSEPEEVEEVEEVEEPDAPGDPDGPGGGDAR